MRFSRQAIVFGAALLAALVLQSCGKSDSQASQEAYDETIRCYKAATAYGQILGLMGLSDEQKGKMLDYGLGLRDRALAEGTKIKKTQADILGAMDQDYLSRFLVLDETNQKAALTDFGKAEVEHCKLGAVVAETAAPAEQDQDGSEHPPSP
jgi:hypothetical protein